METLPKKRLLTHLPEILMGIIILGTALFIALGSPSSLVNWYNNDDGFFYFKVAQNIAAGNGVTFDGINPTNGFHPLWMLICIPIFAFRGDPILPLRIVVILFGVFQFISGLILYRAISARINRWLTFLLITSFIFSWTMLNSTFTGGLESALSCLLMILTWKMATRYHTGEDRSLRALLWVGVIAGLTILSRLDNFIFVGFLGIWLVFDRRKDSTLLLLDMLVPVLLVVVATIQRIGYNIAPVNLFIYLLAGLLIVVGAALFYLFGFYSTQPARLPIRNWFVRGALAGIISAGIAGGIIYVLGRSGTFYLFPRSVLIAVVAAWIIYAATIRAFLARLLFRKEDRPVPGFVELIKSIGRWIKKPLAFLLPVFGLVGAYMVWSQVNFHTPMPVSGQIKQWWGTLEVTTYGSPIHSLAGVQHYLLSGESPFNLLYQIIAAMTAPFKLNRFPTGSMAWMLLVGAYLILLVYEQRREVAGWWDRFAILPFILAAVYRVLYFYVSGYVHMRSWYWTVESFLVFLLVIVFFIDWFEMYPDSRAIRGMIFAITGIAALLVVYTTGKNVFRYYPPLPAGTDPRTYLVIPQMVESMTPPGSVVGTPGGGTLSYFIRDRRVMNLDGLMNSKEYFDALKAGNTHPILKRMNMKYVFANQYAILSSPPYHQIFDGCLEPINPVFGKMLFAYNCN